MTISVEEVLAQLNPKLRKSIMVGDSVPETEFAATPSYGLNRALGGGLPYGRQVLIWGSKSSAKSSLCLQMIGLAQKEGKICAWIDAEMSYDKGWAERLGVDTSKLIVSQARTINEMMMIVIGSVMTGHKWTLGYSLITLMTPEFWVCIKPIRTPISTNWPLK